METKYPETDEWIRKMYTMKYYLTVKKKLHSDVTGGDYAKWNKSEGENLHVKYKKQTNKSKVSDKTKPIANPRNLTIGLRLPESKRERKSKVEGGNSVLWCRTTDASMDVDDRYTVATYICSV